MASSQTYILTQRGKSHVQRVGKNALCGFKDASAETAALPYVPADLCKRCEIAAAMKEKPDAPA